MVFINFIFFLIFFIRLIINFKDATSARFFIFVTDLIVAGHLSLTYSRLVNFLNWDVFYVLQRATLRRVLLGPHIYWVVVLLGDGVETVDMHICCHVRVHLLILLINIIFNQVTLVEIILWGSACL